MRRMRFWILISIFLHLCVAIFFSLKIIPSEKRYIDLSYLTITNFKERKENTVITIKKEGDIKPVEKKADETNIVENTQDEFFDPDKFIPFYLVEELPVPLTKISPAYPEEARRLGIEGAVVLKIYINEKGEVEDVEVIKSPSNLLSIVSKKTLLGVKFKPAKVSGKTVPVCIELTLRFKLSG